ALSGCVMLYDPRHAEHRRFEDSLRAATAITPALMAKVIQACGRVHALGAVAKGKINRLIEAGAWTDAALVLLELELPHWKLRRLACEDGEWFCALTKQPGLPLELDELVETRHTVLPLAILTALVEARQAAAARSTIVPRVRSSQDYAICCDNFS